MTNTETEDMYFKGLTALLSLSFGLYAKFLNWDSLLPNIAALIGIIVGLLNAYVILRDKVFSKKSEK